MVGLLGRGTGATAGLVFAECRALNACAGTRSAKSWRCDARHTRRSTFGRFSSSADDSAHRWLHRKLMAANAQKEGPVGSCRRRATEHSRVTPALLARE